MADWFVDNVGWMHWTAPSAIVIGGLLCTIVAFGIWDRFSPSTTRKGFLPMTTTRGDRLFIGVMSIIGVHLVWLALLGTGWLWIATAIAAAWCGLIARWG